MPLLQLQFQIFWLSCLLIDINFVFKFISYYFHPFIFIVGMSILRLDSFELAK